MDHLSLASSSTTAATTYNQQSVSTFHQDVPKQTYTTAGTIYNPNNAPPLQPPVRRSRGAFKWSLTGGPTPELSLLPKAALAALPLRGQNIESNAPSSPFPKYSPLQQNYDRAVGPAMDHSRQSSKNLLDTDNMSASFISSVNIGSIMRTPSDAASTNASIADKHVDADSSDDDDDETSGENALKNLNVKSLHNLASYPNPNQKAAQKALSRTRPGVVGLSVGAIGSQYSTPSPGSFAGEKQDNRNGVTPSPGLVQPYMFEHTSVPAQTEVKPPRDPAALWRAGNGAGANMTAPTPFSSNVNGGQRNNPAGGYKSTLATGPGAPRPLTAGPPGQRQYRATAFDSTLKAPLNGPNADVLRDDSMDDFSSGFHAMNLNVAYDDRSDSTNQNTSQGMLISPCATPIDLVASLPMLVSSSTVDRGLDDYFEALFDTRRRSVPVVDYEKPESVEEYYPRGLPAFGTYQQQEGDWQEQYRRGPRPAWKPGTCWMTDEELKRRNDRITRQFYATSSELGRSMTDVLRDAENRDFNRRVCGIIGEGRPKPKEPVEYPPIPIEAINRMTEAKAAEPLVTMAFSALFNHLEERVEQGPNSPWEDPHPSLVDESAKGRRSLFGNT
ncbi:hypothetical protein CSOJ01_06569 [Colletotrichum sojae]|uniref:Uncharacterized protein n=1 Tax=Colletotrichum sojae TaxID=2175907 RepID=A0A8H6MVV6_9PEZI|nr:hypothetical protein CSOJ01_06569 [Colletotrichum sojae]